MVSRFKQLLENLNLTSSEFAGRIGVQRSSVSHVLSGRNKPSVDFLEKIFTVFPDIDPGWLITGKGEWKRKYAADTKPEPVSEVKHTETATREIKEIKTPALEKQGPVDYIIIVYKDNTFRILNPSN